MSDWEERQRAIEVDAYNKAEKIAVDDYDEEQVYNGEEFVLTEDAGDYDLIPTPDGAGHFVWACTRHVRYVTRNDVHDMLNSILEEINIEESPSVEEVFNVNSLMELIKGWIELNEVVYYEPDYSRAIEIPQEEVK